MAQVRHHVALGLRLLLSQDSAGKRPRNESPGTAALRNRIAKLERAIDVLRDAVTSQAQDMVAVATGFARTDDRLFIQNLSTAKVHVARPVDGGRTLCGWRHDTATRQNGVKTRPLQNLVNIPGTMMCDVCLKTEKLIAMGGLDAELSGDEL